MEQVAESSPSPKPSSFAGLLASLTSPGSRDPSRDSTWGDGRLGDDVVTLSYERALRNHARYRPSERHEWAERTAPRDQQETAAAASSDEGVGAGQAGGEREAAPGHEVRSASVTIRLSKAECEQLRQRAQESGLTVSAYMRLCVLEADALRDQVKTALAELKAGGSPRPMPRISRRRPWQGATAREGEESGRQRFLGWIANLLARGRNPHPSLKLR